MARLNNQAKSKMIKRIVMLILVLFLIVFVYAQELNPGKLWINNVEIPYNAEKEAGPQLAGAGEAPKEEIKCVGGIKGNVNNDEGNIGLSDLESLSNLLTSGSYPTNPFCCCCSDINADDVINIIDADLLLKLLVQKEIAMETCESS